MGAPEPKFIRLRFVISTTSALRSARASRTRAPVLPGKSPSSTMPPAWEFIAWRAAGTGSAPGCSTASTATPFGSAAAANALKDCARSFFQSSSRQFTDVPATRSSDFGSDVAQRAGTRSAGAMEPKAALARRRAGISGRMTPILGGQAWGSPRANSFRKRIAINVSPRFWRSVDGDESDRADHRIPLQNAAACCRAVRLNCGARHDFVSEGGRNAYQARRARWRGDRALSAPNTVIEGKLNASEDRAVLRCKIDDRRQPHIAARRRIVKHQNPGTAGIRAGGVYRILTRTDVDIVIHGVHAEAVR